MSYSAKNRLQTSAWGRFILSVLVLAWLNIAAQPCLMAMETAPQASLTSEQASHAEQSGHMADAPESADCGHCPPGSGHEDILCDTGSASDCEIFAGYNADDRQIKLKLKDVSPCHALPTTELTLEFPAPVALIPPHDYKRLKFAGDPPLNIRYCVFLK